VAYEPHEVGQIFYAHLLPPVSGNNLTVLYTKTRVIFKGSNNSEYELFFFQTNEEQ